MRTNNVIILVIVALILVILAGFSISTITQPADNNTTNNTTENETLNDTNNTTLTEDNQTQTTNTQQKTKTKTTTKKTQQKSDSEIQERYFTVSENEKGQNEGMEPGRYRERYTANDGPISVDKVG